MIKKYIERAEQICSSDLDQLHKNIELGIIMTEMEEDFRIPVMRSAAYEEKYPEIIQAYQKISAMRNFEVE